jgi:hypothetical protein
LNWASLIMLPPRLTLVPSPPNDQSAIVSVEAVEVQESSDVRLTATDRRFVRWLVALAERRLSDEGLMHLACGAEDTAWRKRTWEARKR